MKSITSIFCVALLIFAGCSDNEKSRQCAQGQAEKRIAQCKHLLSNGNVYCSPADLRTLCSELEVAVRQLTNGRQRMEFAQKCCEMIKGVDLSVKDGDYLRFDREVFRFAELSSSVYNVLKDAEVSKHEQMDWFLSCMERYHKACFKTAWDVGKHGDSIDAKERRAAAIQNMYARYQSDALKMKKLVISAHLKYFPEELHEEYLRRCRVLLAYPSRDEMRRMLIGQ